MRLWYRLRQTFRRASVGLRPLDTSAAQHVLPPEAWDLFRAMPRGEQEHALCVYACLAQAPLVVRQAGLLHDVGKSVSRIRLWHRAAHVLLRYAPAGWAQRLRHWRHSEGLRTLSAHAALGAELCATAGLSREVCRLVSLHDVGEPPGDLPQELRAWLDALRRADDTC